MQATLWTEKTHRTFYGASEGWLRTRYKNYTKVARQTTHEDESELSKYLCKLRDNGVTFTEMGNCIPSSDSRCKPRQSKLCWTEKNINFCSKGGNLSAAVHLNSVYLNAKHGLQYIKCNLGAVWNFKLGTGK